MSATLLDEPMTTARQSPAQHLRANMAAVRVSFTWLGTRKSLTPEQRAAFWQRTLDQARRTGLTGVHQEPAAKPRAKRASPATGS